MSAPTDVTHHAVVAVNLGNSGRVPLKLTRVVRLDGVLVGPDMIVGVEVDVARECIAKGWAEAVPGNTEAHLPELRQQPKAHADSPVAVEPRVDVTVYPRKKGR